MNVMITVIIACYTLFVYYLFKNIDSIHLGVFYSNKKIYKYEYASRRWATNSNMVR